MLRLRHLPLRYRLPLIHGALSHLAKWRGRLWTKAEDSTPRRGDLVVSAFFNESLGIGRGGRLSAAAFKAAGYDIIEHDLRRAFPHILAGSALLPGKGGVWFIHANAPETLVALLAHHPQDWSDRYRIGYWAWETPKAPTSWIQAAGYLHEIWVPSRFVHDALVTTFTQAGRRELNNRIRIMPHPVPVSAAHGHAEIAAMRQAYGLQTELFEVLSLFDAKSSATRKNPWGSIEAWLKAFPAPSEAARLTLKAGDITSDRVTQSRLNTLLSQRADIQLVTDRLSDGEIDLFIASFDAVLSLHRSEGFGLPLAEAMAAGVPVIATGWSGNTDFMTPQNAHLVPARMIRINDRDGPYTGLENDPDQVWADPDIDAAARILRDLAGQRSGLDAMAAAGRDAVAALHAPWRRERLAALPFNTLV